jgi:hypothetical protein
VFKALFGQAADNADDFFQKRKETVLAAFPKVQAHAPALFAEIRGDGRVAVKALVRTGNPLFFGVGVVQWRNVNML